MNAELFAPSVTALVVGLILVVLARAGRAPDFIIWGGLALLMVCPTPGPLGWQFGVITPQAAFAGLANESLATIGALYVVAAGVRETGVLNWFARTLLGKPHSLTAAQHRLVWPTALLSGFFNNTPLVTMLMPVADDWARQHRFSASKLLMPLSFASILGGACTLIGTSTNLVVNGWLIDEMGAEGLGMFEVTRVALPIAIVGMLFMLFTSRWLLPERRAVFDHLDDAREYTVEVLVDQDGALVGKTVEEAGLRGLPGLFLIEIDRQEEVLPAVSGGIRLRSGDRLVFAGLLDSVVDLQKIPGLSAATDQIYKLGSDRHNRVLIEAVVSATCPVVGRTIKEGRFRTRYSAAVVAVARNGERLSGKLGDIRLNAGDTLLLEARPNFLEQQRNSRDFYLVSRLDRQTRFNSERAPVAGLIMLGLVGSVGLGVLPMSTAAVVAAAATVAFGCINASNARRAIDWEVLLVLGGALGLGHAMSSSGLAEILGNALQAGFGATPGLMLAATFVSAMLLACMVTAKAGAVLMLPIALAAAEELGVSFMPFAIAVMLGASFSLATPIGYPTNLMVMGPGGYRYMDFVRLGLPLSVLVTLMSVWLIPLVWPFQP